MWIMWLCPGASQWRIYNHRMWGQLSTLLLAVITEVTQWGTPSCTCSLPQPATDNSNRDIRSNWLVTPPPSSAVPPELHALNSVNVAYKLHHLVHQPGLEHASTGLPDQCTTCAATQGLSPLLHREFEISLEVTLFIR